ncbi:ParB N-terminal domain-containing protein [Paenibacillus glucanolyticus]|uniref:ParB N-terminal domain-containing protein n=1 Tax=Paenibacillus glucanolyticus TaxID=59843 RepID=UPI00128E2372|nr:ParB N-terminal domain-containing protein [Paenibacillus glucanolyticus]MPY20024.1 transcriptional regulator [Paenibacillus glucanolyticus]
MNIKTITIEQINAAAYNPRVDLQPGDPEYEKLKRSIEEFGYVEPIVWNERTDNMVGGHQRYKIMVHEQGHTELAVSVVDLDDQQERLLNIALNKVSGDWDEDALSQLLVELQQEGVDISLSGFNDVDLKQMLGDIDIPNFDAGTAEDQGDLGVLSSKLVTCPHCGEDFEHD